jgi:hypothetical protein
VESKGRKLWLLLFGEYSQYTSHCSRLITYQYYAIIINFKGQENKMGPCLGVGTSGKGEDIGNG